MKISVRTVVLAAVVSVAAALPVAAQEVSLGYQFQRQSAGGGSTNYPAGFAADISSKPFGAQKIAAIGQFDWSRKSIANVTNNVSLYGVGLRWTSMTNPKAKPFVDALVGGDHSSAGGFSSNDFALQVGGGVAGPITDAADWLAQVDYRRIFATTGVNSVRVVLGVRIPLTK
jgi:hypothetical protein